MSLEDFKSVPELSGNAFVARIFQLSDKDRDGFISVDDFVGAVDSLGRIFSEEEKLKCKTGRLTPPFPVLGHIKSLTLCSDLSNPIPLRSTFLTASAVAAMDSQGLTGASKEGKLECTRTPPPPQHNSTSWSPPPIKHTWIQLVVGVVHLGGQWLRAQVIPGLIRIGKREADTSSPPPLFLPAPASTAICSSALQGVEATCRISRAAAPRVGRLQES